MTKISRRVELLTHIDSVKITNSKEEWMLDVQFNQGELVVFKFDGEKFRHFTPDKKALQKFMDKQEKEHAKLNRPLTAEENDQEMKEFRDLPTILEEIEVVYKKEPTSETINLVLYVKELIAWLQ